MCNDKDKVQADAGSTPATSTIQSEQAWQDHFQGCIVCQKSVTPCVIWKKLSDRARSEFVAKNATALSRLVCPKPHRYDLWAFFHDNHGLTLLESELHDIVLEVQKQLALEDKERTDELAKTRKGNVFSRPECVFQYCPDPPGCQARCLHAVK